MVFDAADVRFGCDRWQREHYRQRGICVHQIVFNKDPHPVHADVNVVPLSAGTCLVNFDYGPPEWFIRLLRDNGWKIIEGALCDTPVAIIFLTMCFLLI